MLINQHYYTHKGSAPRKRLNCVSKQNPEPTTRHRIHLSLIWVELKARKKKNHNIFKTWFKRTSWPIWQHLSTEQTHYNESIQWCRFLLVMHVIFYVPPPKTIHALPFSWQMDGYEQLVWQWNGWQTLTHLGPCLSSALQLYRIHLLGFSCWKIVGKRTGFSA